MQTTVVSSGSVELLVFDRVNQTIVKREHTVQLSPKAFRVLCVLYENAQRLVTKDELLDAVWGNVCVVEAVLKNTVREIRKALDDDPRATKFIQTVHGRGYRFVGEDRLATTSTEPLGIGARSGDQRDCGDEPVLVGRGAESQKLNDWWDEARRGDRRFVHINGCPGIGKSALVNAWFERMLRGDPGLLVGRTDCVKTSANPGCLPFLQLLSRLCKGPHSELVTDFLSRHAPGWLPKLPWLSDNVVNIGFESSQAVPHDTLFFQTAEFFESLSHKLPVLLLIEDLQWCDPVTRDLLSYLFLRRDPARLMLVSTKCSWRNEPDTAARRGIDTSCPAFREIALGPLPEESVEDYVLKRMATTSSTSGLVAGLSKQCGGHPLFLKGVLDGLSHGDPLGQESAPRVHNQSPVAMVVGAPHSFRHRLDIEAQTMSKDDWRLLQAASVVVVPSISAAAVAAILDQDVVETEEQCDELARRGLWIRRRGSRLWPDGTLAQLFDFPHPIFRDYIYQTIPAARRSRFHLRHANRLEAAYCDNTSMIASNLAYHFSRGGEPQRATAYQRYPSPPDRNAPSATLHDLTPRCHAQSERCEADTFLLRRMDLQVPA